MTDLTSNVSLIPHPFTNTSYINMAAINKIVDWLDDSYEITCTIPPSLNLTINDGVKGQSIQDSLVLQNTVTVYGSVLVIVLIVFSYIRRKFPHPFTIRSWTDNPELRVSHLMLLSRISSAV